MRLRIARERAKAVGLSRWAKNGKGGGEKWRLPDKQPFLVECQRHALSSENPEKHEHGQNKPHLCKTEIAVLADLPVGGTTGLCHQSPATIEQAAAWYRDNQDTVERPLIPALRRRFGLTAHEAVMALREARRP